MSASLATLPEIDWSATGLAAQRQRVACLLATPAGTVPLHRGLGIDFGVIGESVAVTKARQSARIAASFATHEPDLRLVRVTWEIDADGTLRPTVKWRPSP